MAGIKAAKNIIEEAQYIKETDLDFNLIKIFAKDRRGNKEERQKLAALRRRLKDDFYVEVMYVLSHQILDHNPQKAKKLYRRIINHKRMLTKKLGRNVGVEVASFDYLRNIEPLLKQPGFLERDKLREFATRAVTDKITGIYDRESLYANLSAELQRAKRYGRPLSVLFCDIDDFKKVNDTYGHAVGDKVLQKIADTINSSLREPDTLYRYGGEELVCVLPESDKASARVVARRIQKRIQRLRVEVNRGQLRMTVSMGGIQYSPELIDDARQLISAADQMMYEAKRAGKNRICFYRRRKNDT